MRKVIWLRGNPRKDLPTKAIALIRQLTAALQREATYSGKLEECSGLLKRAKSFLPGRGAPYGVVVQLGEQAFGYALCSSKALPGKMFIEREVYSRKKALQIAEARANSVSLREWGCRLAYKAPSAVRQPRLVQAYKVLAKLAWDIDYDPGKLYSVEPGDKLCLVIEV